MAQEMTSAAKQEVDRRTDGEATRSALVFRPNTDIYETEDHIVLLADLPGVAPQDVDITLERRVLTIRGHVVAQRHDGYRQVYAEYGEGDFERAFTVSEDIDRDQIKASHKNGVLILELPKAATAKTKKIDVKAA
jgi:HSP20 family molecular chaperone IbpA|tara:strand:+ start:464 stop:868 length:405 start_codon:yes stop_codon:yes gene_type:complete